MEKFRHRGIVKKLPQTGRDETYDNGAIWSKLAWKTIDELCVDYSQNIYKM